MTGVPLILITIVSKVVDPMTGLTIISTGWLKSFESDTFLPVEESKFIRYFNISSSI